MGRFGDRAFGDGALKIRENGTNDDGPFDRTSTEGWNGDTTLPDPDSTFVDDVENETLPSESEPDIIGFRSDNENGTDEEYDCTGTELGVIVFQDYDTTACELLEIDDDKIDCGDIIDDDD